MSATSLHRAMTVIACGLFIVWARECALESTAGGKLAACLWAAISAISVTIGALRWNESE